MALGLIGKKVGMTQVFNEEGVAVPVTVVDVTGNVPLQVKKQASDGYTAVQIGFDDQKEQRINKPQAGQFKAGGSSPKRIVREFRLENDSEIPEDLSKVDLGAGLFEEGQWVDVIATTKGKGFQGVVRRYGFGGLPMSHGSMMHRRTGSIGGGSTPGRVWKNKAMPGRQGGRQRTVQNLQVVQSLVEEDGKNYLLIDGPVPGSKGSYIVVRPSKKKPLPANWPPLKQEAAPAKAEDAPADANTEEAAS